MYRNNDVQASFGTTPTLRPSHESPINLPLQILPYRSCVGRAYHKRRRHRKVVTVTGTVTKYGRALGFTEADSDRTARSMAFPQ